MIYFIITLFCFYILSHFYMFILLLSVAGNYFVLFIAFVTFIIMLFDFFFLLFSWSFILLTFTFIIHC